MNITSKMKRAWLVCWNGTDERITQRPILLLNWRWSAKRVSELLTQLYLSETASIPEIFDAAKSPTAIPYPAQLGQVYNGGAKWQGQVVCGHNPFLCARIVEKLELSVDSTDGRWTLSYEPLERPDPAGARSSEICTRKTMTCDGSLGDVAFRVIEFRTGHL